MPEFFLNSDQNSSFELKKCKASTSFIPFLKFQPEETTSPGTVSGSPRRFANQGLVYLSEIQTLQDVNELSVKQAKDILAMNRVNFKGVVEKDELLKHVARLWRQEKQAQDGKLSFYIRIFRRKAVSTFSYNIRNLKWLIGWSSLQGIIQKVRLRP